MKTIGEAFVAAESKHIRQTRPVTSLSDLEIAATEAAMLVKSGAVDLQHAADKLWDIAESTGLVEQHGADAVQARLQSSLLAAYAKNAPGLVMTRMADIRMRAIEWLWPNRIAIGKVTELAGEGGMGKSTLLFDIAARVSRGEAWPDRPVRTVAQSVFILSAEDDPADTVKPRLEAAGADMDKVFFLSMVREGGGERHFSLQDDLARLQERVVEVGDVGAVIIDPVTAYLGKVNSNSNSDVRSVLGPLGDMAARTRTAVICNTHFTKADARSVNHRIIGSVAFVNQARQVIIVTRDPDDPDRRLFLPSKSNISRLETGLAFRIEQCLVGDGGAERGGAASGATAQILATRIAWESAPVTITADAALAALRSDNAGAKTAKAEAVEFLQEVLAEGPKAAGEVIELAKAHGFGEKPLRAARKQLRIKPVRSDRGRGWTWGLPFEAPS